jgi:hypothetical protein
MLPHPGLSALLTTLQTLILNCTIAKGQNPENYRKFNALFFKISIKPEGNRILEGPSCSWMTWTGGIGLHSYGSELKQISS